MEEGGRRSDGAAGLRAAGLALAELVNRLATDWWDGLSTPGFRLLGEGMVQIETALTAIEPTARRTVRSMHPVFQFDPEYAMHAVDQHSRSRGIDLRFITSERSRHAYPLITSEMPHVRFGPTGSQFILIDGATAVVGGPQSDAGYPTAWLATRDDVVARVTAVWELAWPLSRPGIPAGEAPPFTPRQCLVARRVVVGTKDASIARELGVSVRTVAGDVAHLMNVLGARNRAEVALRLRGGNERRLEVEHGPGRPRADGEPAP